MHSTNAFYRVKYICIVFLNIVVFSFSISQYELKIAKSSYEKYVKSVVSDGHKKLNYNEYYDCVYDFGYRRLPALGAQYLFYKANQQKYCKYFHLSRDNYYMEIKFFRFKNFVHELSTCLGPVKSDLKQLLLKDKSITNEIQNNDLNKYTEQNVENLINNKLTSEPHEKLKNILFTCADQFENDVLSLKIIDSEEENDENTYPEITNRKTKKWIKFDILRLLVTILEEIYIYDINIFKKMYFEYTNTDRVTTPIEECQDKIIMYETVFNIVLFQYSGLPNSNDTFESYSIRRKIYLNALGESFSHISSAPLGLISPEKFNELREGKTIKGENYPTYLMRIHLNGYVPLKKDLWTKEYNELYPDN